MFFNPYIAQALTSPKKALAVITQPTQGEATYSSSAPCNILNFPLSWTDHLYRTILLYFSLKLWNPSGRVKLHSHSTKPGQYRSGVSKVQLAAAPGHYLVL